MTVALAAKANSFDPTHRGHCFNHTLNLAAKATIAPFYSKWPNDADGNDIIPDNASDITLPLEDADSNYGEDDNDGEEGEEGEEDPDDGIDEVAILTEEEREQLLRDTNAVRLTVTKVRRNMLPFQSPQLILS